MSTYLRGWYNGEGVHDSVRVLFTDFGDQEGAHAGASAASQGVCQLEALQAVAALSLFAHNIKYRVHELSAFCVVSLGPVVASA